MLCTTVGPRMRATREALFPFGVRAKVILLNWPLDAADLVEKSEAEGRKLRRASNLSRSLV